MHACEEEQAPLEEGLELRVVVLLETLCLGLPLFAGSFHCLSCVYLPVMLTGVFLFGGTECVTRAALSPCSPPGLCLVVASGHCVTEDHQILLWWKAWLPPHCFGDLSQEAELSRILPWGRGLMVGAGSHGGASLLMPLP